MKLLLLLLLMIPLQAQQPGERNKPVDVQPDSATVADTTVSADSLFRIDTIFVIDTVRLTEKADTTEKKQEPTFIFIDSTSNGLPSFGDMVNSLNPVRQIGIFRFALMIFIVAVASALSVALTSFKRYATIRKQNGRTIKKFLPLLNWAIWFLAAFLILRLVFVNTQLLVVFLIVLTGVILGIAALPLVRNLLGRIFILSGNMFSIDDYIKTSVAKGFVKEIGWKHITILNDEGSAIFIPNSYFIENPFENISRGKKEELVSLDFDFPSSYDPGTILRILKDAAVSNPFLYVNIEPEVFIKKVDFLNGRFTVRVNMYLYDSAYIDELYDAMNQSVLKKLRPYRSEMDIHGD